MCVLDITMITLKKYSNNSRLLFTNADGLMYEIKKEGVYEYFSIGKETLETKFLYHALMIKYIS